MASGSFDLTTYYAKRIIGDNGAGLATSALLQIGTGVTVDTWVLHKTGRASNYGIKYKYDYDDTRQENHEEGAHDKIEFIGGSAVTAWIQLDTGDASFNGNVSIGGSASINNNLEIAGTLALTNSTDLSGTSANAVALIIGGTQSQQHIEIDNNEIQAKASGTTVGTLNINLDGGNIYLGKEDANYSVTIRSTKDASSTTVGGLVVNGGIAVAKKIYANGVISPGGSVWAGSFEANTAQSQDYSNGVRGGAGKIYFYTQAAITGDKGIYGYNANNDGAVILKVNQNNRISQIAGMTTSLILYNDITRGGPVPNENTYRGIQILSKDIAGERKILGQLMNIYTTSGVNEMELVVTAPRADSTNNWYGLRYYAGASVENNTTTTYSFSTLDGCLTIIPNQTNYRQGIRIKPYSNWSELFLCGNDNANLYGTSANSWIVGNNNGDFYITRNGASDSSKVNFSSVNNYWRLYGKLESAVTGRYSSILHIYGNTYGNSADDIQSSTAGMMTYGDPGPQITFGASATPGSGQCGALLFTDNDTAGTGASFHFLSTETDWNVISKRFHATDSITVSNCAASAAGRNTQNTTWISPGAIELSFATPYIDFHYNNDASDFTHRLISTGDGLRLTSKSGTAAWLYLGNGTDIGGIYWPTFGGGWYMNDSNYVKFYNNKQLLLSSSHTVNSNVCSGQLIVSSVGYNSNLDTTAGGAVALELWRGANASWQIINDGGNLYFKNNWTTAKQSTYSRTSITVAFNTGNTTIAGSLTVNNLINSTYNNNTVTIGSQNTGFCHIYNSANIPFIFNNTISTTSGNLGSDSYPWNNLYIGKSNGAGIYYVGTKATYRMIRFIDNTNDTYGNGISIGGGGLTMIGSGESCDTLISSLSLGSAGGTETMYIGSDGDINFYPNNNSYDASALCKITASRFWAGVNGNTTRESQVGAQAGAGQIYIYSQASTSGARGLYVPAHGTGSAKAIIDVNTNNEVTINGNHTNINGTKRELQIRYGYKLLPHNSSQAITFSPAFSNTCLAVFAYNAQGGFGSLDSVSVGNRSKTGCTLFQINSTGVQMSVEYIAIGY